MIAMIFYSDLFHGIGDSIRFFGIDYTPIIHLRSRDLISVSLIYQVALCNWLDPQAEADAGLCVSTIVLLPK